MTDDSNGLSSHSTKSLDRALLLFISTQKVRLSGVRNSFTIVYIQKFFKKGLLTCNKNLPT